MSYTMIHTKAQPTQVKAYTKRGRFLVQYYMLHCSSENYWRFLTIRNEAPAVHMWSQLVAVDKFNLDEAQEHFDALVAHYQDIEDFDQCMQ